MSASVQTELSENVAFAVSRQFAMNNVNVPQDDIYCFDVSENIYSYFIVMYIRKDHYAYQHIFDITQRALEAGLFVKWSRDSRMECRRPVGDVNLIIRIEQIYASIIHIFVVRFDCISIVISRTICARKSTYRQS